MYIPTKFEITNKEEIYKFIQEHSFGQLISLVDKQIFATHMPFYLSEDRSQIFGHLAKQNPQHQELEGQEVLIVLQGPHDYISPAWFDSPGVPTWNYQAVHIYGQCRTFENTAKLKELVEIHTSKYEASSRQPWQPDYNPSMLNAIVGIEVKINKIQCKFKLSQNRSPKDR